MQPTARQDGLIATTVDGNLIIYDTIDHRYHHLNRSAALVWQHCDGTRTVTELGELLAAELNKVADEGETIRLALHELHAAKLLAPDNAADQAAAMSRRASVRRIVATGVAMSAIPLVMSLAAPQPADAQSVCLTSDPGCAPKVKCVYCGTSFGKIFTFTKFLPPGSVCPPTDVFKVIGDIQVTLPLC